MQNQFPNSPSATPPPPVQRRQGHYFHYALPSGWQAQENSNLICLTSPDGAASIMAVGLVGLLQPVTPEQFVSYALNMHQMYIARLLNRQPIAPAPGCTSAERFEIVYVCNGAAARADVTCHVALGYNQCNASLTLAASREAAWTQYQDWLPGVAAQVQAAGPHTYMASTVNFNNQRDTQEFGQRLRETNNYINALHQQTTDDRWRSQDQQNFHRRENLGNVATYYNPYEGRTVEMPTRFAYYWVSRQGQVYGSDNPSDDPRVGSPDEWTLMNRSRP